MEEKMLLPWLGCLGLNKVSQEQKLFYSHISLLHWFAARWRGQDFK